MHFRTRFPAFRTGWMYIYLAIWLAHSLLGFASIPTNRSPVLIVFDSSKFDKKFRDCLWLFSVLFHFHLNRVASLKSSLLFIYLFFCKQVVFKIWKLTCGRLVIRGYEDCVRFSSSLLTRPSRSRLQVAFGQSRCGHPKVLPVTQCRKFGMVCDRNSRLLTFLLH